jgi:hypothetical protein
VLFVCGAGVALVLGLFGAAVSLSISAGLATNIYSLLHALSGGALVAGIVAGFGVGAVAAQAIWAVLKKMTLAKFLTW